VPCLEIGLRENVPSVLLLLSKEIGTDSFDCDVCFSNAFLIVYKKFVCLTGSPFAENLRYNAYWTKKFLCLMFEVHLQVFSSPLTCNRIKAA
jgi:hypothetical protein